MSEGQAATPAPDRERLWRRALSRWGLGVDLSFPEAVAGEADLAWIDLRDRRTRINLERVDELGITDRLEALFAHEAGHHCRYPRSLVANTKLLMRQRDLLAKFRTKTTELMPEGALSEAYFLRGDPKNFDFLHNLHLDVLVNHCLADAYAEDFAAIYRSLLNVAPAPPSVVFAFTLAVYEALWSPEKPILDDWALARMKEVPGPDNAPRDFRAEATELAAGIDRNLDNPNHCLDLFLEAIWPYLVADEKAGRTPRPMWLEKLAGSAGELSPDEWREVIHRSRAEREADRAREERRHPVLVELPPDDPPPDDSTAAEGPGSGELADMIRAGRAFGGKPEALSRMILWYYERAADQLQIEMDSRLSREPIVPTTLAPWEPGADPSGVDWAASLGRAGVAIPGLTLLEREYERDDSGSSEPAAPWLEIYIDSSGSMPNPSLMWSPLAFAGLLLIRACLSAGSQVRIVQFSGPGNSVAMEGFTADRAEATRCLLEHLGGGTQFPFDILASSLDDHRSFTRLERVVLTDFDFFHNIKHAEDRDSALEILDRSGRLPNRFTAVLNSHGIRPEEIQATTPAGLEATGIRVIGIDDWNQLYGVVVALGRELFGRR